MALSDELAYVSANDLAAKIRGRELSPVEVIEAFIERIDVRNPSLNALVFTAFDEARDRAKLAEQLVVSGQELGRCTGCRLP